MKNLSHHQLWPWEQATVPLDNLHPTGLPLAALFWGLLVALCLCFYGAHTAGIYWLTIPLIARLAALDLSLRVLPHIYTLPLLLLGIYASGLLALWGILLAISLFGFTWLLTRFFQPGQAVCGGGDIMLILVLAAWLGPFSLPLALLVAGGTQALALLVIRLRPLPFGPALLLSFVIFFIIMNLRFN